MDISAAVVITLARRPDRLAAFQTRWDDANLGVPLHVHPAVDGLTAYPDVAPPVAVLRGCLDSHRQVLGSYDGGALLVLEDDAVIHPPLFTAATRRPPPEWDLLRLGGLEPNPYRRAGWHALPARGSHAYLAAKPAVTLVALEELLRIRPALADRPKVDTLLNALPGGWVHSPAVAYQDTRLGSDVTGLIR